ncbi:MAG TPA: NAD-glutamate dehydrogenase domain-containing protein, partial [Propionibacteriaceae bacterium]|nr:NAD-glutamate dehydrogenase domain-containing protein [Propionibacteriaceae bacterium]
MFDDTGSVSRERRFLGLFSSSAYSESVSRVPLLRQKAAAVLRQSGYSEQSHGGKAVIDVLETYPRDELFQARADELAATVEKIAHLKERRQVRMFVRRDPYGRYLSCLIYLPRDRYTTAVRQRMEQILLRRLGGASIEYTARVSESVLARLHFVLRMPLGEAVAVADVRALERELTQATRTWADEFADLIAEAPDAERLATLIGGLPEGYKEDYTPRQAVQDLAALTALEGDHDMSMALYVPDGDGTDLRLKIFRREAPMSLSRILPHLTLLGVDVIDERPYELGLGQSERAYVYDLGLTVPGGPEAVRSRWTPAARQQFMDAFSASYRGLTEPDGFHALVMGADLHWREVTLLRTVGRYLRQVGLAYSQTYIAQALSANVDLARLLITQFQVRFDPELPLDQATRSARAAELTEKIKTGLNDVVSLDHDRILRWFLAVLSATVRTNFYASARQAIALKLLPRSIPELPAPRPQFEIFVYSPRLEGVHLRFGPVARGGLRWSDRAEDFRTEILGLVKAQMVKNAVIVPVGAKGGFYCKRLPDPSADRQAWLDEGVACYQMFITSLLDVTDNLVDGVVVPPHDVIRYDGDDPYLVVAADKGTATFSDLANQISVSSGFWLGDAFASGGSSGYDHKAMGITARGAWVSVQRHFEEMGKNPQTDDFTCVGIGDMSGDVFGNGMLLSRHTNLIAAFDHRHVFLDPDPDPERSWAERARLLALPRSSWADYDTSLISAGGGVFPRTAKSVAITEPVRAALGLVKGAEALTPAELINACLKAPVDLLWNGGIGTYVKAAAESHAEVGDKANDGVRVNGDEVRARCVGEGGNLGLTQRGRIEYALCGDRVNTDFLDNSAGVDTSDHEVNIKILLSNEMAAGRLSLADRDELLASMTDEVAAQVLANNYDQNLALANAVHGAASMVHVHEDWMARLEDKGLLDREIEFLPSTEVMEARQASRKGLTEP